MRQKRYPFRHLRTLVQQEPSIIESKMGARILGGGLRTSALCLAMGGSRANQWVTNNIGQTKSALTLLCNRGRRFSGI